MKSKHIEFPDCWEEVTPHEWVYLLKLRSKLIRLQGVTIDDVKRMWCAFVVKRRGIRSLNRKDAMVLIYRLAQTLDWQWVVENDSISLNYDSTVNLLPEWYGLIGPASHGADLTFGEFRYAVIMMNEYTTTQDIMYLNSLCAVLYRKTDESGKRVRFSQDAIQSSLPDIEKIPEYVRWGIYAWFASFCKFLFTGTFILDGCEICFAPVFGSSGNDYTPEQSLGMNSILFSVAESGVFGTIEDVDNTQLMRVLLKLLDDKQKADSLLKHTKKNDIQ